MKHTPGPWKVVPVEKNKRTHQGVLAVFPSRDGGFPVCSIAVPSVNRPRPQDKANAALIAAAPELLAALKMALPVLQLRYAETGAAAYREQYEQALAAIAKAEAAS